MDTSLSTLANQRSIPVLLSWLVLSVYVDGNPLAHSKPARSTAQTMALIVALMQSTEPCVVPKLSQPSSVWQHQLPTIDAVRMCRPHCYPEVYTVTSVNLLTVSNQNKPASGNETVCAGEQPEQPWSGTSGRLAQSRADDSCNS